MNAKVVTPAMLVLAALAGPLFLNNYWLHLLISFAILAIVALGFNLLMGYAGQVSLGHAGFYAIGAYGAALLVERLGWSFWPSLVVAAVLSGALAYVVGLPTLRLKDYYLAIATLGFGVAIQVIATQWSTLTGGAVGLALKTRPWILGLEIDNNLLFFYLTLAFLLLAYFCVESMASSRPGRAMLALKDDEEAAASVGVEVAHYKREAFVISAVLAALGGALYASFSLYINPLAFTVKYSVLLLAVAAVGGLGRNPGMLIGAAFVTFVPEMTTAFKDYYLVIYSFLIILFLVFWPSGLYGFLEEGWVRFSERLRSWRGAAPLIPEAAPAASLVEERRAPE